MGREIRRVPPDWEHPRDAKGHYRSLCDKTYQEASDEWYLNAMLWEKGEHPDQKDGGVDEFKHYGDWSGPPPTRKYYRERSWTNDEATAYQIYETVSEGTPVSPVFQTAEWESAAAQ